MAEEKLKQTRRDKIEIRLTSQEKRLLCQRAGKGDMSNYIRGLIFHEAEHKNFISPEQQKALQESLCQLKKEINHIGVNINQIVKNHNSMFYSETEKRKLFALMGEINKKMEHIVDKINW